MSPRRIQRRRPLLALLAVLGALAALAPAAAPAAAETGGAGQTEGGVEEAPVLTDTPFDRQGMWIWYVSASDGGSIPAMVARAKRFDIGTVYVKSADGGGTWSQFSRSLVSGLHAAGIDVCAWQFVYGDAPVAEARAAIATIKRGADCFVIDAEGDYEGKYAAADRYVRMLRAAVGEDYPIGLAGFPYVDYHPAYPYSVFLGPGGATFNLPQMYWKTIGTSVREIFEHTYLYNRIWGHPVYPLGQTYEAPGTASLKLFRRFAASYGGLAPSWWDWQETGGREWGALGADSAARPVTGYRLGVVHPLLKRGSKGDMVVWAQEHLIAAGHELPVTGIYGKLTRAAVREFQEERGLPENGAVDTETWEALMALTPYRMQWAGTKASGAAGRAVEASRPASASLPAKAYEIDPGPGR